MKQESFLDVDRSPMRLQSRTNPLYYVLRKLGEEIAVTCTSLELPAGATVLDYGCADSPYKGLLPSGASYLGADLPGNPWAQVTITPEGRLPVPDASTDLVLSTQVLEHVENPHVYLTESLRVLRPGGRLLLSTHGMWNYHPDPVDYWRWTSAGLRKLVTDLGFAVERFEGVVCVSAFGLQLLQHIIAPKLPRFLQKPFVWCMQAGMEIADRLHSRLGRSFDAAIFVVVARKPVAA